MGIEGSHEAGHFGVLRLGWPRSEGRGLRLRTAGRGLALEKGDRSPAGGPAHGMEIDPAAVTSVALRRQDAAFLKGSEGSVQAALTGGFPHQRLGQAAGPV